MSYRASYTAKIDAKIRELVESSAGLSIRDIAHALGLKPGTALNSIRRLLKAGGVSRRWHAAWPGF